MSENSQEMVADISQLLIENYCIVASSALLWFDFVLTLTTEYQHIWKRKLTGATLVYFGVRHVAVIERIFFVPELFVWNSSDKITAEAIVIFLTWVKTFGILKDARRTGICTPLASLILRDGTAYFLFILISQLAPLVLVFVQGGESSMIVQVWPYFSQVFINIALSRFVLNLRALYFADDGGSEGEMSLHSPDMRFRGIKTANIVGNLGATLMLPTHAAEYEADPFDLPRSLTDPHPEVGLERDTENENEGQDALRYSNDPFTLGILEALSAGPMVERNKPSDSLLAPKGGPVSIRDIEMQQLPGEGFDQRSTREGNGEASRK
ncbi:hypothetical protein GY45DRAFT_1372762 [Cubamyces sp. BRFM 1775]|nr:hypothetical protein GY45DRAFT_1372762 [Cubamyces sp. BRFM 1775]